MRKNTSASIQPTVQLITNTILTITKICLVIVSILSSCLLVAVIVLTNTGISVKLCAEGVAHAYYDGRRVGQLEECLSLEATKGTGTLRLQPDQQLEKLDIQKLETDV